MFGCKTKVARIVKLRIAIVCFIKKVKSQKLLGITYSNKTKSLNSLF